MRSDPDASWNATPEKPLFGYKMHLARDQGSEIVRRALLTPAHVSDKALFLDLVQGGKQILEPVLGPAPVGGQRL